MPKPDKCIGERARWLFEHLPFTQRFVRGAIYWKLESQAIAFVSHPKLMKRPMKLCLSYLERRVKDPELRATLTPNYRLGCKRVLLSSNYYRALVEPNVNVITTGIREIVADGIVIPDHLGIATELTPSAPPDGRRGTATGRAGPWPDGDHPDDAGKAEGHACAGATATGSRLVAAVQSG